MLPLHLPCVCLSTHIHTHTHTTNTSPPPPPCVPPHTHTIMQGQHDNRPNSFLVYAPSRTCAVYGPSEWADPEADRKPAGIPGLGVKELGPYYEY